MGEGTMKMLGIILIILVNSSWATDFKGCSQQEENEILEAEMAAETAGNVILNQVEEAIHDDNRKNMLTSNNHKLKAAKKMINCALNKVGTLKYHCIAKSKKWDAQTFWVLGRLVTISPGIFTRTKTALAAAVFHEHTHKCGANDAAYFRYGGPEDKGVFAWSSIADTYEYWIINGFCIPGETCEPPAQRIK